MTERQRLAFIKFHKKAEAAYANAGMADNAEAAKRQAERLSFELSAQRSGVHPHCGCEALACEDGGRHLAGDCPGAREVDAVWALVCEACAVVIRKVT